MKEVASILPILRRNFFPLSILVIAVVVIVVGLLISNHTMEVMRFSGSQSPVFVINGNSKDYFLEPVAQTNYNLCGDPTLVTLYRQGNAIPVYNGQVTYYTSHSGSGFQLNWSSMFLPDGLTPGSYYFLVQQPSCRTGVTLALLKIIA